MKQLLFILTLFYSLNVLSIDSTCLQNDPGNCENRFEIPISGQLNEENSKLIKEYIFNRKGICTVEVNIERKMVIITTVKGIDEESIKYLVLQARINFVEPENE